MNFAKRYEQPPDSSKVRATPSRRPARAGDEQPAGEMTIFSCMYCTYLVVVIQELGKCYDILALVLLPMAWVPWFAQILTRCKIALRAVAANIRAAILCSDKEPSFAFGPWAGDNPRGIEDLGKR